MDFYQNISIVLLIIIFSLFILLIYNLLQKQHSLLRNYPIIGYIRYYAETIGIYLRQYFYARDREELPFNRMERTWVYEAAKNKDTIIGFGSTLDLKPMGSIYFVDSPFPLLKRDFVKTKTIVIG